MSEGRSSEPVQKPGEAKRPVMLGRACERTLRRSLALAGAGGESKATREHLLLALVDDADARAVLDRCGVDGERLRAALAGAPDGVPRAEPAKEVAVEVMHVVQRAAGRARDLGARAITGADLLLTLLAEGESRAAALLGGQGLAEETVAAALRKAP